MKNILTQPIKLYFIQIIIYLFLMMSILLLIMIVE
jgi:hypothetical protein